MSNRSTEQPRLFDLKWLLDNEWEVTTFKNKLGSYTAQARRLVGRRWHKEMTDHFTPADALQALAEKISQTGAFTP